MVAHVFRLARMGRVAAGMARGASAPPPPHPPRGAARDLLLYHHWLAQLASGETTLLVYSRDGH